MKIHNIRMGHACNSSSMHSVIIADDPSSLNLRDEHDAGSYGWDSFTLVSKEAKKRYGAINVFKSLRFLGEKNALNLAKELTGCSSLEISDYIDHQSELRIPLDKNGKPLQRFIKDYMNFLEREDVVVLGGNDNGGEHPLYSKIKGKDILEGIDERTLLGTYDDKYDYYTLYVPTSGDKIRLSFNKPSDWIPEKSKYPELVDLKITDYCNIGCDWCYQDSTTSGKHGDIKNIKKIIDVLGNMGVFEIAIGGGETTQFPEFKAVVEYIKSKGITPNFTTQSLAWLNDAEFVEFVSKNVGAVAFSVPNEEFAKKLNKRLSDAFESYNRWDSCDLTAQYVMGTFTKDEFFKTTKALLKDQKRTVNHITLLGYKETGRGNEFKKKPYDNWGEWISEIREEGVYVRWGIDTKLAEESAGQLEELEIPKYLYTVEEGKFSMYIDAVEMKCGRSSYTDKYEEIGKTNNLFKEIEDVYSEL